MEEWLSVNIIPDLVNVRDALKELDKGSRCPSTMPSIVPSCA